jgi:hypothetical protein
MVSVLGIDLAYTDWRKNGSAVLSFEDEAWSRCQENVVSWPDCPISAAAMAGAIEIFVLENEISAVSLDGPQGWRDPAAPKARLGVGRACEKKSNTPGKTGVYGIAYPANWVEMAKFCEEVFTHLIERGYATLVNDPSTKALSAPALPKYYLLECFPTWTWRTSGLKPLPGHTNASPSVVLECAKRLIERYDLPRSALTDNHDDLQAIVAALPAAGLLQGPCIPMAVGESSSVFAPSGEIPAHRIEGLIWSAKPILSESTSAKTESDFAEATVTQLSEVAEANQEIFEEAKDYANPLLPDDRHPQTSRIIERGKALFLELVRRANAGESVGIGYAQFVCHLYGVEKFSQVSGHRYRPSDSGFVIRLAMEVTQAAGGRQKVTKHDVTILASMDTFIWNSRSPYDRPLKAWTSKWCKPLYSREDWLTVFPNGTRSMIKPDFIGS